MFDVFFVFFSFFSAKWSCFVKMLYFCGQKSIGEQSVDVQNLVMTFRASQPVDFFLFLCLYRCYAILHLLACPLYAYHHFYKTYTY